MNSDDAMELIKKGFRITLGATTSLVESIQDPQRREENLAQMRANPNEFAERLADKGAVVEGEARRFVDSVVTQYSAGASSTSPTGSASTSLGIDPTLERELRDLTAQLAALRSQIVNGNSEPI